MSFFQGLGESVPLSATVLYIPGIEPDEVKCIGVLYIIEPIAQAIMTVDIRFMGSIREEHVHRTRCSHDPDDIEETQFPYKFLVECYPYEDEYELFVFLIFRFYVSLAVGFPESYRSFGKNPFKDRFRIMHLYHNGFIAISYEFLFLSIKNETERMFGVSGYIYFAYAQKDFFVHRKKR